MRVTIYHNPRCSKSRETLELLHRRGLQPAIVDYLRDPPGENLLAALLAKLGMDAMAVMRRREPDYLAAQDLLENMSEEERIGWLARHPGVIERPIVVSGERARIGRPPEAVLEILR